MHKRLLWIVMLFIGVVSSACTKYIDQDTMGRQEIPPAVETPQISVQVSTPPVGGIEPKTRAQAGLSTLEAKDISSVAINSRIEKLLNGGEYVDKDYASGIVQGAYGLIINERFIDNIIGNIRIGSDINEVSQLLGEPTSGKEGYLLYKTNSLYLGFSGDKTVDSIVICRVPDNKDDEILSKLITAFENGENGGVFAILEKDQEINEFFDENGHIHGGGWYADSGNGVTVEDFDGLTITVYNNFEGKLYESDLIVYDNQDYMLERLRMSLDSYFYTNEQFAQEGLLSPSGKYKSIYNWIHSERHHFIIRTMDNSKPDFYIGAPVMDYKWINDEYIIYLDFHSDLPFAVKASEDNNEGTINIFYETGITKTNDSTEDLGLYSLEISDINEESILLKDSETNKQYWFQYIIDSDGKPKFTYLAQ